MRQGSPSGRRPRGRHNNNGGNGHAGANPNSGGGQRDNNRNRSAASLRHQTFDSNGPDVRVRGNAWQVHEKYQSLARDAQGAGDHVLAENLLQHAEHYFRVIEVINEATAAEQRQQQRPPQGYVNQQPEVPSNYYTPEGQLAAGQPQPQPEVVDAGSMPQPDVQAMPQQSAQSGEATAPMPRSPRPMRTPRDRRPPREPRPVEDNAPSPFLVNDEIDEVDMGPQKLVVGQ